MTTNNVTLAGKSVLVIGGSSGIGLAAAEAAASLGAAVTICSRSAQKVDAALTRLGAEASGAILDTTDDGAVSAFFAAHAPFDHIVVSAAQIKMAPVRDLPIEQAYASMNSKFWGAYRVARAAAITPGGSLTLVSGFMSMRPRSGAAILAAINAGLEGLTRGLALEFAPTRVNAVSPGLVMTPMYDGMPQEGRDAMYANAAQRLPAGLAGKPEHIAVQIMAFLLNPYMTGSVVYVDGGGLLA